LTVGIPGSSGGHHDKWLLFIAAFIINTLSGNTQIASVIVVALNSSLILAVTTGVFQRWIFCCFNKRRKCDNVIANGVTYSAIDCLIANKAIPVQAWTGPEGYRRLRLPDFKKIGKLRW